MSEKQPITVTEEAASPLFETTPPYGADVAYGQLIRVIVTNPNIEVVTQVHGKVEIKPLVTEKVEKRIIF